MMEKNTTLDQGRLKPDSTVRGH